MKKIVLILAAVLMCGAATAQNDSTAVKPAKPIRQFGKKAELQ